MTDTPKHESVLDIGAEQLGKPYAKAMLGAAASEGVADQVIDQLAEIVDEGLANNTALAAAFSSPRISGAEKERVINRLLGDQVHPVLLRTLKVINSHGRLGFLPAVRKAAVSLHDEQLGRIVAEVRTAVPLDDSLRGAVIDQLGRSFGSQIRLREVVDEDLIGGMVVRVGDTIFDSSVADRLNKVGKSVAAGFAKRLLQTSNSFISASDPETESTGDS